jgi:hypothetical protein
MTKSPSMWALVIIGADTPRDVWNGLLALSMPIAVKVRPAHPLLGLSDFCNCFRTL